MDPAPLAELSTEPLFGSDAPIAAELERLLAWERVVLEGRDTDLALLSAWAPIKRAVPAALAARIRAGEAPAVAIEVLAGLTALVLPNHRMRSFWHAAWELSEPEADGVARALPLTDRDRERRARHAASVAERAAGDPERAARFRETLEVEARTGEITAARERIAGAPSARVDLVAAAERIGLIGAGGPSRADMAEVRPLLWANRAASPGWEALCAAFDTIGAGSFAGLDRLGALARLNPGSPAIAWLDEIACAFAREERGPESAARLDELLKSGAFGRYAREAAASVRLGREAIASSGARAGDAWLRLWEVKRDDLHAPRGPGSELLPDSRAAVLRAARRGDELAKLLLSMDRAADRAGAADRVEAEREGPFHGLGVVPEELAASIDAVAGFAVLGFRETYGLELLRDAAPRLREWLAGVGAEG